MPWKPGSERSATVTQTHRETHIKSSGFDLAERIERGESDEKRISFWPFAVAGIGLFGLGIAGADATLSSANVPLLSVVCLPQSCSSLPPFRTGGNAFMSGSVSAGEEVADAAAQQQQQQQQQQAKPGRRRA
eukprot:2872564-Rhodomonas_salina.1